MHSLGFAPQARTPTKADIRMFGRDSAEEVRGGFRTGLRRDRAGVVWGADGSLTTQRINVTRRLDIGGTMIPAGRHSLFQLPNAGEAIEL